MDSELLTAWYCCFLIIGCVFFLGWLLGDGIQFTRAIRRAYKDDRLKEWYQQDRRMWPGSGYRLFKIFNRPPK